MAGQGRTLLILGGVLAAGIAAAVWFALSGDGGGEADAARDGAVPLVAAKASAVGPSTPRAKKQGTSGVFGEIRRTAGRAPVAGQEVLLAPERGEPYSATTDEQGAFKFEKIPHG